LTQCTGYRPFVGPRVAVPRLSSVVEFCGNELKICGNKFGIVPSIDMNEEDRT
jgi:hypothetical protein